MRSMFWMFAVLLMTLIPSGCTPETVAEVDDATEAVRFAPVSFDLVARDCKPSDKWIPCGLGCGRCPNGEKAVWKRLSDCSTIKACLDENNEPTGRVPSPFGLVRTPRPERDRVELN